MKREMPDYEMTRRQAVTDLATSNDPAQSGTINDDIWEEEPTREGEDGTGPTPTDDDEEDKEEPPPGSGDGNPDPPK
jgi:hypothetical protein